MWNTILIRVSVIIGILIALTAIVIGVNEYMAHRSLMKQMDSFTGEYEALAETCLGKETQSCCLSSVSSMQAAGGHVIPDKGCPKDFVPNSTRCIGAYSWCEKIPEKENSDERVVPKNINIYS